MRQLNGVVCGVVHDLVALQIERVCLRLEAQRLQLFELLPKADVAEHHAVVVAVVVDDLIFGRANLQDSKLAASQPPQWHLSAKADHAHQESRWIGRRLEFWPLKCDAVFGAVLVVG